MLEYIVAKRTVVRKTRFHAAKHKVKLPVVTESRQRAPQPSSVSPGRPRLLSVQDSHQPGFDKSPFIQPLCFVFWPPRAGRTPLNSVGPITRLWAAANRFVKTLTGAVKSGGGQFFRVLRFLRSLQYISSSNRCVSRVSCYRWRGRSRPLLFSTPFSSFH